MKLQRRWFVFQQADAFHEENGKVDILSPKQHANKWATWNQSIFYPAWSEPSSDINTRTSLSDYEKSSIVKSSTCSLAFKKKYHNPGAFSGNFKLYNNDFPDEI